MHPTDYLPYEPPPFSRPVKLFVAYAEEQSGPRKEFIYLGAFLDVEEANRRAVQYNYRPYEDLQYVVSRSYFDEDGCYHSGFMTIIDGWSLEIDVEALTLPSPSMSNSSYDNMSFRLDDIINQFLYDRLPPDMDREFRPSPTPSRTNSQDSNDEQDSDIQMSLTNGHSSQDSDDALETIFAVEFRVNIPTHEREDAYSEGSIASIPCRKSWFFETQEEAERFALNAGALQLDLRTSLYPALDIREVEISRRMRTVVSMEVQDEKW